MKSLLFLSTILIGVFTFAQTPDFKKAPNSYVFDKDVAKSRNYDGINIPVKKAYEMWAGYEYLQSGDTATPIPAGVQSALLYWEDVPGIVKQVSIIPGATPQDSKIKVTINNALGNGNAVVAFKVNNVVYWSWHVWITDDPSNGVTYSQGFETDIDMKPISIQYMDRNLGAGSKSFLGYDWQKAPGLMYEWGRKDPFPGLVNLDGTYYEINSELGSLTHPYGGSNPIPVVLRPYNDIERNIQFSVKNPLTYLMHSDKTGNWFSSERYKDKGTNGTDYVTWDLWSDNAKGRNSNANSSNVNLKNDSRSYELKSELDPCPNGWRIPSYYGRVTMNNNLAFFGRNDWKNDEIVEDYNQIKKDVVNPHLDGIKVYPGLGMDFTKADNGNRNLGIQSLSGQYGYYLDAKTPMASLGMLYQDTNANGTLWSSTFGYDGARGFSLISDPFSPRSPIGTYAIYINQTFPTQSGGAVRCMRDPNMLKIGNFATEYFSNGKQDLSDALYYPNTYMVTDPKQITLQIPVAKAFAVYNQLFSDKEMLPSSNLVAKVFWTNNEKIVKGIAIDKGSGEVLKYKIVLNIDPAEKGIAVVSLHNGSTTSPAYWSWTIWLPNGNPTEHTIKYTTEQSESSSNGHFAYLTKSTLPPLATTFMDRNLGAVNAYVPGNDSEAYIQSTKGTLFQWGRKDPIPSFSKILDGTSKTFEKVIYIGSENQSELGQITYTKISDEQYLSKFSKSYQEYNSSETNKYKKIMQNIKYSVNNPLTFMYQTGLGQLYDGNNRITNKLWEVRDWVLDQRSNALSRWGHGGKKSPFDPCPEGWRVPDVSLSLLYTGHKGNSPFYNSYQLDKYGMPGVIQDQWNSIEKSYFGSVSVNGWSFTDSRYPIGNFSADGIRGELGENTMDNTRSGVWTASLTDRYAGYGLAMQFQNDKMVASAGAYPQAAMSVRCAKDEARYLGVQPTANDPVDTGGGSGGGNGGGTGTSNIPPTTNNPKPSFSIYPNPFVDMINISSESIALYYQIFDFAGTMVVQDYISNNKIDAKNLKKGIYLIKLTLKDGTVISKKIMKY